MAPVPTPPTTTACPAQRLTPQQRRQLARAALAGTHRVSQLARDYQVSRKFVYQQRRRAHNALDRAFAPPPDAQEPVLFTSAVTRARLRQIVLALVLICHRSLRGVVVFFADVFDYRLSLGSVFNILRAAVARARQINGREDLSAVRVGADDEIFQGSAPVLVGVDPRSTYCYLLSLEEHRDGATWGVRLLERTPRGFAPDAFLADAGSGLRAGHEQARPQAGCRGDVFHALYEVGALVRSLEKRAYAALEGVEKLLRQQQQHAYRQGRKDRSVARQLRPAQEAAAQAIAWADDVATLYDWLRQDIWALAGPDYPTRRALLDWVVAELQQREGQCPHRIGPVRRLLANQGADLLAFAAALDEELAVLAAGWQVSVATVRQLLAVHQLGERNPRRWPREASLRQQLGRRYHGLSQAVQALARRVVRASSVAENLNSRLRNYFFRRRQLGPDYLALLQFYLNHQRFPRSAHPERVGQSPAELLSGQKHEHWLEMLGYRRFRRAS